MYEVKVFDGSGNLKQVISVRKLNLRSQKQLENPGFFRKNKKAAGRIKNSATCVSNEV